MLLYRISGTDTWVDWDVLHNDQGYSTWPCVSMTYKKISPWGTDGGSGYKDSQTTPFYFVSGNHGWLLAVSMPGVIGLYPSEATPLQMINGGVVSNAVTMDFLNGTWYLIEAEIANERYWLTESMVEELGWEVYEEGTYEFVFVDSTTGRVVHGVEQLDEMVFVEESAYPIVSKYEKTYDSQQTLADGAYIDTVLPYYTSKLYIAGIMDRVAETVVDFSLTVSNEGGYVRVTNNTGASVTLTRLAIQSMDATGAEVVEVVDGQDNHAYAFKWDGGGTPYWWISYSGERHWTDTLGNWSEVPSVVLPTVSTANSNWLTTSNGNEVTIAANGTISAYNWTSGTGYFQVPYDSTKAYAIRKWYDGVPALMGNVGLEIVEQSGYIALQNKLSSSTKFAQGYYATCSDSTATVVTVYNSSNVAYNAFKFTANNTDYYYVLDGTQTDWTDDLSSIGYSLGLTAYLNTAHSPTTLSGTSYLYAPDSRFYLTGDQSKIYTIIALYSSESGESFTDSRVTLSVSGGYLVLRDTTYSYIVIQRVEYTVS